MIAFSRNQYRLSALMFITINLLFYFKYLYRISVYAAVTGILLYLLFSLCLFWKNEKRNRPALHSKLVIGSILIFTAICLGGLCTIPCETLKVDRWEVINVFWDSVSQGINPYGVKNSVGNYPGPMPIYFLLYYPFYLIGEVGYSTLILLLIWLFYFYKRYSPQTFSLITFLLLSSAFIYWEVFTRSTILVNACLFCYFLLYSMKIHQVSSKQFYLSAILGGLLFSIRNIFILPLIIWAIYMLRSKNLKWKRLFIWGSVFILSFGLTFTPFFIFWLDEFLIMNPFFIQSSVLIPFKFILLLLGLSVYLGCIAQNKADAFFYSNAILFLMIVTHLCYWIFSEGFIEGYLNSRSDISYFLFSIPFILEIIAQRKQIDYDKR